MGPEQTSMGQRARTRVRFENDDMDFLFVWALGYAAHGGPSTGECHEAARTIRDGDPESWTAAWTAMAERIEAVADRARAGGHHVSARSAFLRASGCWRFAESVMPPADAGAPAVWERARACFRAAARLFEPPVVQLEAPYAGVSLSGYLVRPPGERRRRPTLLMVGGGETIAEELYFWAAVPGVARGYNVCFFDLPGQGEAIRRHGLPYEAESERPVGAILDALVARDDVDPARIALHGASGGGYFATRAAVVDRRIGAVIGNSPIFDLHRMLTAALNPALAGAGERAVDAMRAVNPFSAAELERVLYCAGVSTFDAFVRRMEPATYADRIEEISCPVLCLVSEGEPPELHAQAEELHRRLRVPTALRTFTEREGAATHCQVSNLPLQQQVVFDWLDQLWAAAG